MGKPVRTRRLKAVRFTLRHALNDVEETVNKEIDNLTAQGKKIISVTHLVCGNSPAYILYNIIYETDVNISEDGKVEEVS